MRHRAYGIVTKQRRTPRRCRAASRCSHSCGEPAGGKREIARAFRLNAEQKASCATCCANSRRRLHRAAGTAGRSAAGRLPTVAWSRSSARRRRRDDRDARKLAGGRLRRRGSTSLRSGVAERRWAPATGCWPAWPRIRRGGYEARVIRRLHAGPVRTLGIFELDRRRGRLLPVDRRAEERVRSAAGHDGRGAGRAGLGGGPTRRRSLGLPPRAGRRALRSGVRAALHQPDLHPRPRHPARFPDARHWRWRPRRGPAPLGEREDLREVPLVTIDGEDARDFDDAVWAEPERIGNAAAGTCWSPSPTSPGTSGPAVRSTARRRTAATRSTSPTGSCRCCRRRCPTAGARLNPARTGPVSPLEMRIDARRAAAPPPLRPRR